MRALSYILHCPVVLPRVLEVLGEVFLLLALAALVLAALCFTQKRQTQSDSRRLLLLPTCCAFSISRGAVLSPYHRGRHLISKIVNELKFKKVHQSQRWPGQPTLARLLAPVRRKIRDSRLRVTPRPTQKSSTDISPIYNTPLPTLPSPDCHGTT